MDEMYAIQPAPLQQSNNKSQGGQMYQLQNKYDTEST